MIRSPTRIEVGQIGRPPTLEELNVAPLPETVIVNFSKACNLWCTHCLYPQFALEREQAQARTMYLPAETWNRTVDEIASWNNRVVLRIAADGEPLMNPKSLEMIAYSKKKGVTTALTTNGILLTSRTAAKLLETGIDVIDISIDAATAESYGDVRRSRTSFNFFERVEQNVRDLIQTRNRLSPQSQTKVMVNLIDQPSVHGEVDLFVRKWTEWGADAVLIRPFHSTSNQTMQDGVATKEPGIRRFPCKYPFTRLNVGFDEEGHAIVYYCSHDWNEKTVLGILGRDGGLRDIWHGAAMEEIRRRHRENDYPPDSFCGSCPDWYLGWGKSHHQLVRKLNTP